MYATPKEPPGGDIVVMVGDTGAGLMIMESALVSLPALFVASTVKLNVPDAEGVPDITPADERVRPLGRLPDAMDQVAAGYPVAVRV